MFKRLLLVLPVLMLFAGNGALSQTLVSTYNFNYYNQYNAFWGITQINDSLWFGTQFSPSYLYKVTKTGIIADSVLTPFTYNHGLVWDGTGFWVAQDFQSAGAKLYKINRQGVRMDTINTNTRLQGIGGLALDGNSIWAASYYPDFTVYPFDYAYKFDLTTKAITDSIPLRGKQVQGIAVKGDTIFYVTDNFQGDAERIYAYRKAVGDTLFSFAAPDPDNDCDPRGLFWDGQYLWLMANRIGNNVNAYRTLYKYNLYGAGSPQISGVSNVSFGNVSIGSTGNQPYSVTNTGTAKLIISAYTMTNSVYSITPNNVPDTINPGATKNYTLGFTPTVFDTAYGELRIASNDAGTPLKVISLHGKGVYSGAYIGLSQNSASLSNRRINSLSGFAFDVTNQGTLPLTITGVNFGSARYKMDMTNVAFPITIDTQRTRTFRIWFNPIAAASYSDTAVLVTNAVNGSSAKIGLTGTGVNNLPSTLGDIMWQGTIPNNPLTSLQDLQPKSLKQINDVNGDGINDIIVSTANYWTICYNGNSSVLSDTLWKFNTYFGSINTGSVTYKDAVQSLDDINGDGVKDIVIGIGGGNEMVYVLSGKDGKKLWEAGDPVATADGDINGIRTDKDFNGDGKPDVLVAASGEGQGTGRHSAICYNGLNGQVIFTTVENAEFCYDIVSTTFGGAIAFNSNGGPYGVNGFNNTGSGQWNYSTTGNIWSMKQVPDLNGDGNTDIVGMYGFNGGHFAISGSTGLQIYGTSLGSSNNGTVELLDDANKNGFPDFTYSGPQGAYRIDTKTDSVMWQNFFGSSYIRDADMLGDITGDTTAEVLFSTQQPGQVYVLNGRTGVTLFQYTFGTTLNERADRVSHLNSIDGNATNEFVACSRDGRIKCFSGGEITPIGIQPVSNNIPRSFALYQNYPNPFNPATQIKIDVPKDGNVKMVVYDILGRETAVIVNSFIKAGTYKIDFNAAGLSSGVYFYEMSSGDFRSIKKMILLK